MDDDGGSVDVSVRERGGGRVATVVIGRPGKANALGSALMEAFAAAMARLSADEALRAVVVTGAGDRAFVAGADVREMAGLDEAGARAFILKVHGCCAAVRDCPVPVIARIGGACFGAGLELAAACDLRVAAEGARFGMPEVRLGIPSVVEAALLPGLVGWGRARQMVLLGDTFGAAEAERWGLVGAVAPPEGLDAVVERWVASLLAGTPGAVRAQKALVRRWEDLPLREAVAAGVDAFGAAYAGGEPAAAMAGFGRRG